MTALEGMRVLDMTQYEAGPSGTQLLAWLGADVVKLEPLYGEPGRGVVREPGTMSQYFMNYNSNKRSIAVDVRSQTGHRLVLDLIPKFDVFIENYGAGVVERLGLDYDVLKQRNPGLIYGRIKGFGLSGPYSGYNCYDWVAQAAAGAFSVTGYGDGPPMMPGTTVGDSGTGLQMALAIVAAFVQKQRTGKGQLIELSMQEAVTLFMRTQGLADWGKAPATRTGSRRGAPTTDVYPCKPGGPNDYLFMFVVTSAQWDALCAAMGRMDLLVDERFCEVAGRVEHGDALYSEIEKWTLQHDKYEAMRILAEQGVPCSAVLDTSELFTDPHLAARGFIRTVVTPAGESVLLMDCPLRMSESPVGLKPAPALGEDTVDVLSTDLQFSAERIRQLKECGVIGSPENLE